jgi:UDP-glucose 4-epimerase
MKSGALQRVLVIGASGFLGRHLVEQLLQQKYQVLALDRYNAFSAREGLEYVEGSFLDVKLMASLLQDCDAVFHLASTTLPKTSNDDPLFDIESNLKGAVTLLDLALEHDIQRLVFISSGGTVYGPPEQLPVPESHATDPACSYGIVKLYGEYQSDDSGQGALTAFCHRALAGEPIEIWGDGSVVRDFVYAGDAIDAMIRALDAPCAGETINIGSGQGVSLNQLLDLIEEASGQQVVRDYRPGRDFDVPEIYLDIAKAQHLLAWQPQVPLAEGIGRLVAAMRERS